MRGNLNSSLWPEAKERVAKKIAEYDAIKAMVEEE